MYLSDTRGWESARCQGGVPNLTAEMPGTLNTITITITFTIIPIPSTMHLPPPPPSLPHLHLLLHLLLSHVSRLSFFFCIHPPPSPPTPTGTKTETRHSPRQAAEHDVGDGGAAAAGLKPSTDASQCHGLFEFQFASPESLRISS